MRNDKELKIKENLESKEVSDFGTCSEYE